MTPYFTKPYHSWERGLNENHNGLKNQPLDQVTQDDTNKALVGTTDPEKNSCLYIGILYIQRVINKKNRMRRESHVRFWERLKGKILWATRPEHV